MTGSGGKTGGMAGKSAMTVNQAAAICFMRFS